MDALKITIFEDSNKYHVDNKVEKGPKGEEAVLGEVWFADAISPSRAMLNDLEESLLALFPCDAVRLEIRYSVCNN